MRQLFLGAIGLGLAISWGCAQDDAASTPESASPAKSRAAVQLTLLVVDDPELAAAARSLRGEWAERSGGDLLVVETTLDEMLTAERLEADVIVYLSRHVGTLVARDWLRPVRKSVLNSDNFALGDLLPLVRNESMRYAGEIFGASLGEPPLLLAFPLLLALQSPELPETGVADTWKGLDERLSLEISETNLAAELIARAASYVGQQHRSELLFDAQSMTPRLKSPPIVRALESMVAWSAGVDEAAIPARFTWPSAAALEGEASWRFSALPRAASVFDSLRDRWQPQTGGRSPTVLGFGGRSLSVTRASRNTSSAFKLFTWLATGETAIQLSSRSHATVWPRSSQRRQAARWLGDRGDEALAELISRQLSSDEFFLLPRMPGIDRYLKALGEAAAQATSGKSTPAEALESATLRWEALTESLGRPEQLLAYRRHLGLADTEER